MHRDFVDDGHAQPGQPLEALALSRMRDLSVAERVILRDGRLIDMDFDAARQQLLAQSRTALPRPSRERYIASRLARAVRTYYGCW